MVGTLIFNACNIYIANFNICNIYRHNITLFYYDAAQRAVSKYLLTKCRPLELVNTLNVNALIFNMSVNPTLVVCKITLHLFISNINRL